VSSNLTAPTKTNPLSFNRLAHYLPLGSFAIHKLILWQVTVRSVRDIAGIVEESS